MELNLLGKVLIGLCVAKVVDKLTEPFVSHQVTPDKEPTVTHHKFTDAEVDEFFDDVLSEG